MVFVVDGGWGYYLDEGSSNVTVRGNLAFNLKTAGFTQHCERHICFSLEQLRRSDLASARLHLCPL